MANKDTTETLDERLDRIYAEAEAAPDVDPNKLDLTAGENFLTPAVPRIIDGEPYDADDEN